MSQFVQTLREVIEGQEPPGGRLEATELVINRIEFQKLQPETKLMLQGFRALTRLSIVACDLRTLDNFPVLPLLKEVCLANNRLQGTVEHLVKLENLEYLDLSNNLIKEVARLCPLKRVKDLTVCLVGNPFLKNDGWKPLLDSFHFTVEKQARDFAADTKPKQQPPQVDKHHDQLLSAVRAPIGNDFLSQDSQISPRRILDSRRLSIRRYRAGLIEDSLGFQNILERRIQERYERELAERAISRPHHSIENVLSRIRRFGRRVATDDPEPALLQQSESESSDKPDLVQPIVDQDPIIAFDVNPDDDEDDEPNNFQDDEQDEDQDSFPSSPSQQL